MVLTAPPPPVDALPFHGAHDWQAAARPASTGDVAVAGPSSPYSRPPPGLRRKLKRGKRRGDPDSWGTRPIDLYWNERVRKTSPTAVEEPGLDVSWDDPESVRRAAARLESSTALIHGRGPKDRAASVYEIKVDSCACLYYCLSVHMQEAAPAAGGL